MLRFVLLRHRFPPGDPRPSHWDFMLEKAGVLWTWQLQMLPQPWWDAIGDAISDPAEHAVGAIHAIRLVDHRLAYLDYEGPVSHNRGRVTRCDTGTYQLVCETPGRLEIQLTGKRLQGRVALEPDTADDDFWFLKVVGRNEW